MAAATSPATGRTYGVRRVCAIWGVARSSFYDAQCQDARPPERPTGRPGPKPALSDAGLLAAIRRDLARSPWTGEGHRKVWARLRMIYDIRVSRSRVLRIMGENHLLSPHRRPPRPANDHDGSITTEAPNVMWGADGAVIPTVEDGNVTLFIVAEHWNGEGLGWHVAKHGNRYAAAEALALAVNSVFGAARADAARGVLLRHDHGSAFMSDYFQNQLKVFGMAPSFAFVRQPETNGVAERFIRTLKEQIVFGRVYQDIEEVRAAVRAYFERYNEHWLLEKNGYRSPAETRRRWMAALVTTHEAA
ncbi:MAG: IS3 family transposase [Rhodospirillales bacterium]